MFSLLLLLPPPPPACQLPRASDRARASAPIGPGGFVRDVGDSFGRSRTCHSAPSRAAVACRRARARGTHSRRRAQRRETTPPTWPFGLRRPVSCRERALRKRSTSDSGM